MDFPGNEDSWLVLTAIRFASYDLVLPLLHDTDGLQIVEIFGCMFDHETATSSCCSWTMLNYHEFHLHATWTKSYLFWSIIINLLQNFTSCTGWAKLSPSKREESITRRTNKISRRFFFLATKLSHVCTPAIIQCYKR